MSTNVLHWVRVHWAPTVHSELLLPVGVTPAGVAPAGVIPAGVAQNLFFIERGRGSACWDVASGESAGGGFAREVFAGSGRRGQGGGLWVRSCRGAEGEAEDNYVGLKSVLFFR